VFGVILSLHDLVVGQFDRTNGVAAGELGRRGIVGDRLDFEDVQPAEFRDLLEGQRCILDQPGGGRMGHQGLGHFRCLRPLEMKWAAPSRSGRLGARCSPRLRSGQGYSGASGTYRGSALTRSIHSTTWEELLRSKSASPGTGV